VAHDSVDHVVGCRSEFRTRASFQVRADIRAPSWYLLARVFVDWLVPLAVVVIVVSALVALYVSARRATTIAEIVVVRGRLDVVRGGVAPPILADLRDVAEGKGTRLPKIQDARIRITRSDGRAEVTIVSGELSVEQSQCVRNVIGSVPLARLINARRKT